MEPTDRGEVTTLLAEYTQGNGDAIERLIRHAYPELRRMARRLMSGERMDHTLSATALVHEGFLRLFGHGRPDLKDSRHFFLTAAMVMQHVLTDHARRKLAGKRNGDLKLNSRYPPDELVFIGELLGRLEAADTRAAEVVRLRFYMGMTAEETAATLGISRSVVQQDWKWASAWLRAQMNGALGAPENTSDESRSARRG